MNIAIMAHDKKKEQLLSFCVKNAGILSRHKLFATGATGKILQDIGLDVHCFMSGRQGGDDQVAARIAYDEVDFLIFFRDGFAIDRTEDFDSKNTLLRLCDIHNVLYATNVVTAEVILNSFK